MHLSGGDGFATMADGKLQYIFSFADLTRRGDVDGEPMGDGGRDAGGGLAGAGLDRGGSG